MSRRIAAEDAVATRSRRRAVGRGLAGGVLLAVAACRGKPTAVADGATAVLPGTPAASALPASPAKAQDADAGTPRVDPRTAAGLEEVQRLIEGGASPERVARLADIVSRCGGEPTCQVPRRMALAALRAMPDRSARVMALLQAGQAYGVEPEVEPQDDPLWPELVQSLSEAWAAGNTSLGRSRMLHEKRRRSRLLLVSSLAVYAASNRGLSDLTIPQRRTLRAEFMRLYPTLPQAMQQQIDAFVARIDVNARGTL